MTPHPHREEGEHSLAALLDRHYLWSHPDHTPRIARRSEASFASRDPLWVAEYPIEVWAAPGGQEPVGEIVGTEKRGFALMTVVRWEPGFNRMKIGTKLYAGPIAGVKVPLTEKQIEAIDDEVMKSPRGYCLKFARAIEAAHGIRATAPASQEANHG